MARIVTMGELLVEIMRPSEGIELYQEGYFRGPFPSGAPGIFISTVARLNHPASIIGGVGNDDFGKVLCERFKKDGVDTGHLIVSGRGPTGTAHVTYFADGQRKFIFHVDHTPAVEAKMPNDVKSFGAVSFFHIMGCSLMASVGFGREILKTMYAFRGEGAKISFDPNVRLEMLSDRASMEMVQEVYRNCQIFMPGASELKLITGAEGAGEAVKKAFADNGELELLVLKNGSEGSYIYDRSGSIVRQGIYKVVKLDPTGAGDSFDGAFICGLSEGKSVEEAARMGAAAGALNTAAFGPMEGAISPENLEAMIKENIMLFTGENLAIDGGFTVC